jgi:hypothetical protein
MQGQAFGLCMIAKLDAQSLQQTVDREILNDGVDGRGVLDDCPRGRP